MKILLVALNAQYIHTNLAVRSIAAYAKPHGFSPSIGEYTINQPFDLVLRRLYEARADVYQFSCYIWNVDMLCRLAAELKKLLPAATLLVGGPQVSYHVQGFLKENPAFTAVLRGEGEATSLLTWEALQNGKTLAAVPGLSTRERENPPPAPLPLDLLPIAYTNLASLPHQILYYESMRGCPFRCSYCLSSVESGLRFKSTQRVLEELGRMLQARPRQVKFVDRSFNCNPAHALAIWRFLQQTDNGVTNFHFEIHAESLNEEMVACLLDARPGLFQLEVGVQTCNPKTLTEIRRTGDLALLFTRVRQLQQKGNLHLHLDLIAGLPHEDYASFAASFDRVYAARPHQLQLGFLKVLSGSLMEQNAAEYGLAYTGHAPFEVLRTHWLTYEELCRLKTIAHVVELYYNSGRFSHTAAHLCSAFPSPFAFYEALAAFYAAQGFEDAPPSKLRQYALLGDFATSQGLPASETLQWLCRLDMALHEKPKKLPAWVTVDGSRPYRTQALAFYADATLRERHLSEYGDRDPKQLLKSAHLEFFPFNPFTGSPHPTTVLFSYARRDITGRAYHVVV